MVAIVFRAEDNRLNKANKFSVLKARVLVKY